MEERSYTMYYNSSIYHISIHSKLLDFESFSLCHYLGDMILDMPNTFLH